MPSTICAAWPSWATPSPSSPHPRPEHPPRRDDERRGEEQRGGSSEESRRDRLIRLAQQHPRWALGFLDETWNSASPHRRLAAPSLHTWTEPDQPLHLPEQTVAKEDPDPKALACYGLLLRTSTPTPDAPLQQQEDFWLRFVAGRPVSAVTIEFLDWCCAEVAKRGQAALLLVWDNASWHVSATVRTWIAEHNRQVKQSGQGVRLLVCRLPTKSPWLNPIEPKWLHGKRRVVEPNRLLTAAELRDRVCAAYGCANLPHLTMPEQAA